MYSMEIGVNHKNQQIKECKYPTKSSNDLFGFTPCLTVEFTGGDMSRVCVLSGGRRLFEASLDIGAGGGVSERRPLTSDWTQSTARLGGRALQRGALGCTRRIVRRTHSQRRLKYFH